MTNAAPEIDPVIQRKARLLIDNRFRHALTGHPFIQALRVLATEKLAGMLSETPEQVNERVLAGPSGVKEGQEVESMDLAPVDVLVQEIKLPALPQIIFELQKVINDPKSRAEDVARVISMDASLSAFLLRMVNSAFYNLPAQVETISRAVALVGTKQLSTLAIGTSVFNAFKDTPPDVVNLELFWQHSLAVGLTARGLAKEAGREDPERYFTAGLLHDLGRLVLFTSLPEAGAKVLATQHEHAMLLYQAEEEVLGFDHGRLGAMLLRKWNFPFSLSAAILCHHHPEKNKKGDEASFLHIADIMAKAFGWGASGEYYVAPMSEAAWDGLGLRTLKLKPFVREIEEQLAETSAILFSSQKK